MGSWNQPFKRSVAQRETPPVSKYKKLFSPLPNPRTVTQQGFAGPTTESNWVIPDQLMVGAYPGYIDDEENDFTLASILHCGVTTFVCLQQEYHDSHVDEAQWRSGQRLRPYIVDAKRLLTMLPQSYFPKGRPSEIGFVHFPIVDCSTVCDSKMVELARDLVSRMCKGEVLYVHCWGGHGRSGVVASLILGIVYGVSATDAMWWVQTLHDLRDGTLQVPSPQTRDQREQVTRILKRLSLSPEKKSKKSVAIKARDDSENNEGPDNKPMLQITPKNPENEATKSSTESSAPEPNEVAVTPEEVTSVDETSETTRGSFFTYNNIVGPSSNPMVSQNETDYRSTSASPASPKVAVVEIGTSIAKRSSTTPCEQFSSWHIQPLSPQAKHLAPKSVVSSTPSGSDLIFPFASELSTSTSSTGAQDSATRTTVEACSSNQTTHASVTMSAASTVISRTVQPEPGYRASSASGSTTVPVTTHFGDSAGIPSAVITDDEASLRPWELKKENYPGMSVHPSVPSTKKTESNYLRRIFTKQEHNRRRHELPCIHEVKQRAEDNRDSKGLGIQVRRWMLRQSNQSAAGSGINQNRPSEPSRVTGMDMLKSAGGTKSYEGPNQQRGNASSSSKPRVPRFNLPKRPNAQLKSAGASPRSKRHLVQSNQSGKPITPRDHGINHRMSVKTSESGNQQNEIRMAEAIAAT
eukprot:gb/GECG01015474.1/.p1 GENE.gb/GECG01015474.1/~~gb/GECG01015474.1/.p1  ORF type:complete len:694 (+),score=66.38 gb/GECG01015474.1/:1-2082(+)